MDLQNIADVAVLEIGDDDHHLASPTLSVDGRLAVPVRRAFSDAWSFLTQGDFNGDGLTDLLGRSDSGRLRLQLNTGRDLAEVDWGPDLGVDHQLLGRGDVNDDGLLDLISLDRVQNELWVSVNTLHGFRRELWAQLTGPATYVFLGDFNGDQQLDVLLGQPGSEWVIAKNSGTSFELLSWGSFPLFDWVDVVSGDFDGDAIEDVAARADDNTWWLWRGTSSGLENGSYWGHWRMRSAWYEVDVGDFDGDGRDDVIGRSADGQLWVGRSTGTLFHTWTWGTGWVHQANWSNVAIIDLDHDGLLDRVGSAEDETWWFARNIGQSFRNYFWQRSNIDDVIVVQGFHQNSIDVSSATAVPTGSVDNYEEPFVVPPAAMNRGGRTAVSVWLPRVGATTLLTVWADFNHDGRLTDELVYSDTIEPGWNLIELATPQNAKLGDAQLRFRFGAEGMPARRPTEFDHVVTVLTAEPDVLVEYGSDRTWVVQRNDGRSFSPQVWPELYQRQTWTPIATGDFTGDGATDILGVQDNGRYWLLKNGGSQLQGSPWGGTLHTVDWTYRHAADYDSDGDQDLMAFESQGGTWWLTTNLGDGSRNEYWGRIGVADGIDFYPGDFNRDGRPDIVVRDGRGQLTLAENQGDRFATRTLGTTISPDQWQDVRVGDFNGDELLDIAAHRENGTWWLWLGGNASFSAPQPWGSLSAEGPWQDVSVADVNDDGVDDVLLRDGLGTWWLLQGSTTGFRTMWWGQWSRQVQWSDVTVGRLDEDHLVDVVGRANGTEWWVGHNTGVGFENRFYGYSARSDSSFVVVAQNFVEPPRLQSGLTPDDVEQRSYGDYAREALGNLMQFGTDRYGEITSSGLMNVIDVRSRLAPETPLPLDSADRVIRPGRRGPGGSNLYIDQPTLRAFQELAKQTADERYAGFVEENLRLGLSRTDENGLIWWGWHRFYDAYADELSGNRGNFHEIQVQQPMWEELWQVDATAVAAEIEAIWEWHIVDKETGENNRHDQATSPPLSFAHSAGEYIYAFAFLYTKTHNEVWMDRAKLVANYYWQSRNPQTNLVPYIPNANDRSESSRTHTGVIGMYARSLLLTFELTGEPLFRDQALAILVAYDQYAYDDQTGNYWSSLNVDGTPVKGPRVLADTVEKYEPRGYIDLWQPNTAGTEFPLATAQAYALAYELTNDLRMLQAAQRWSDLIERSFPARHSEADAWYQSYSQYWAPDGTYAENYGRLISFALHMNELTKETSYLDFAKTAANEAISKLYFQGLFRGHHAKPYYESIDGVGYLLLALLQLESLEHGNAVRLTNF